MTAKPVVICSYKNILSYFSANCCGPGLNLPFRMNLTAEGPQLSLTAQKATGLKKRKREFGAVISR